MFLISTGARFSEALGLTWDCIDLDNYTVKIHKTGITNIKMTLNILKICIKENQDKLTV
ncbi:tyrosine-type recombinase/integrase [Alkalihalobacillus trypoxylicola]|uniref:tyrosine-type recombinase/integrase n=1 Tax=Alkalihalobacillus trypoxylicola TaxID=519424 RepID=UPI00191288BA